MKSSSTISVTNLPGVEAMRFALVGVKEGRVSEVVQAQELKSTDKARRIAIAAARLCAKQCFFCGAETSKQNQQAFRKKSGEAFWQSWELCRCLAPLMSKYEKFLPWDTDIETLINDVRTGKISRGAVAYRDNCAITSCQKPFEITAGEVERRYSRFDGKVGRSTLCKECALKIHRRKKDPKDAKDSKDPKDARETKAARPRKAAGLTATLGERVRAHVAEAQKRGA